METSTYPASGIIVGDMLTDGRKVTSTVMTVSTSSSPTKVRLVFSNGTTEYYLPGTPVDVISV